MHNLVTFHHIHVTNKYLWQFSFVQKLNQEICGLWMSLLSSGWFITYLDITVISTIIPSIMTLNHMTCLSADQATETWAQQRQRQCPKIGEEVTRSNFWCKSSEAETG